MAGSPQLRTAERHLMGYPFHHPCNLGWIIAESDWWIVLLWIPGADSRSHVALCARLCVAQHTATGDYRVSEQSFGGKHACRIGDPGSCRTQDSDSSSGSPSLRILHPQETEKEEIHTCGLVGHCSGILWFPLSCGSGPTPADVFYDPFFLV